MAIVTFPIELGGSGLVVSDDTDPTTGLRNGGYLTRFVPALQQTVAVAGFVVGQATAAANSATAAAGSASAASASASSAASSANSAATLYDQFDDRYLGPKAANPTVDNDGNALLVGAMYFNTVAMETRVWNGTAWQTASVNGGTVNTLTVTGVFSVQGNTTLGDASTDTVQINGYASIGGVPDSRFGLYVRSTDLVSISQEGVISVPVGTSAATSTISGFRSQPGTAVAAFTVADVIGYRSLNVVKGAGSTITNQHGFYVADQTQGVNNFGLTSLVSAGTNKWNIYASGTAANYFAGQVQVADGSESIPSLSNFGDENTGVFFPAPDTVGIATGGAQRFRIDNSGRLDIGSTVSAVNTAALRIYRGGGNANYLDLATTGGDSRITAAGIAGAAGVLIFANDTNTGSPSEAARITSARYLKASNTGLYGSAAGLPDLSATAIHNFQSSNNAGVVVGISSNTGAAVETFASYLETGASGSHFEGHVNNVAVYRVLANGDVRNTNNSYGAISDPKLKDIIGPKASTWEKTKAYNWIEYYLKSDNEHVFKMLGLNAAEAALVSPGVVEESPDLIKVQKWRDITTQVPRLDENDNPVVDESGNVVYDEVIVQQEYWEAEPTGEFTKSVKYSVVAMQYHRTTQECQQRIESLESAQTQTDDLIQQLMGRVAALESTAA